MIWLIIAAFGSLLSLIVYSKTKKIDALVFAVFSPVLGFLVGLVVTTVMGISYLGPAWEIKSVENYPLHSSPNVHMVEVHPYLHKISVIDKDGNDYVFELEKLPFHILDTDGRQTLVLQKYGTKPKNIWVFSWLLKAKSATSHTVALIEVK